MAYPRKERKEHKEGGQKRKELGNKKRRSYYQKQQRIKSESKEERTLRLAEEMSPTPNYTQSAEQMKIKKK